MPAAFRNWPSVAPGCRIGSTGTPGQNCAASFSMGARISRVSGGGGELGPRVSSVVTLTAGSATSSSSFARTVSCVTPGKMRQLMFARARCGRALVACPASSMVATQVVRKVAFQPGSFADTSPIACASAGSRTNACMALARAAWPWAACIFAMPVKYARLPSVNCGGKV